MMVMCMVDFVGSHHILQLYSISELSLYLFHSYVFGFDNRSMIIYPSIANDISIFIAAQRKNTTCD
jgi:hypothetical protein